MKKEPTIKNVLAEVSHIEARVYNLTREFDEKGFIIKGNLKITNPDIRTKLLDIISSLCDIETMVKEWIEPNMLK